jgi:DNA-binding NtrC family response regulator
MDREKILSGENALARCMSDCEKMVILHVLRRTGGNRSDAAQILGTTKRVLTAKIHKYEIDCAEFEQ